MNASVDRRGLLGAIGAAGLLAGCKRAAPPPPDRPGAFTTFPIWPGAIPGGTPAGVTEREMPRIEGAPPGDTVFVHVTQPTLTMCAPRKPNGAAILLLPGGGYRQVAIGGGGQRLMQGFADAGYCAFMLKYRLPGDPWAAGPDAPLQDAQRALRMVRSRADAEGFDAGRIALWGGSAGGHLAARLCTASRPAYGAVDGIDALPLGVKAAILHYPVNLMTGPHAHAGSREHLFAHDRATAADPVRLARFSAEADIGPATPPTFLVHALDDTVVPVENSLSCFAALRRHGVPAELHVQETGGHGFGWNRPDGSAWDWQAMALNFLQRHVA